MFCSKCGKTIYEGEPKCANCGEPVGESHFPGKPYTSAQQHILPGHPVSFSDTRIEEAGFEQSDPKDYVRTDYTSMTDAEKGEEDVNSRTVYRPAEPLQPEPAQEEVPEAPEIPIDELSDESRETLRKIDEELLDAQEAEDDIDLSRFKARPIKIEERRGARESVQEYIKALDEKEQQREARAQAREETVRKLLKRKPIETEETSEETDDIFKVESESESEAEVVKPSTKVKKMITTKKVQEADESEKNEDEEKIIFAGMSLKQLLKVGIGLILAAVIVIGGALWFRSFRAKQSSAPIEGITDSLYTEGIEMLKSHTDATYVEKLLANTDLVSLNQTLQADATALDALMPAEPAVNDALFLSTLQSIQTDIGTAVILDATAASSGSTDSEESSERWTQINTEIAQLESASTAAELTGILNSEPISAAATATPMPSEETTTSTNALSKGDKSDAVLELQNRLYQLGYLLDDRDGAYGTKTQTAVKLFQNAAGLPVTGIADEATLEAIYSDDAPMTQYATITPTPEPTDEPETTETEAETADLELEEEEAEPEETMMVPEE